MKHDEKRVGIVPDTAIPTPVYDASCRRCVRLARFLDEVRAEYPNYRCLPVPPFGDPAARLVIVGLAPGMHGANATGRPFTGDFAGISWMGCTVATSNERRCSVVVDGNKRVDTSSFTVL